MLKPKLKEKGQTILEVVVAIGILAITLGGIVILLINVANFGSSAEARSMAVNYAQEAVDAIKTIRDNKYCDFFSIRDGYYNLNKPNNPNQDWQLTDYSSTERWFDIEGMTSTMKDGTGMKSSEGRGRSIYIEPTSTGEGKKVAVTIKWLTKGLIEQEYKVVTELYKWKY